MTAPGTPDAPPARWCTGTGGAVSAGSLEATQAGLHVLEAGGNAFDAAIAVAATVAVTLPMSVGFGGDLVAVTTRRSGARPQALLALGAAPARASIAAFHARGLRRIPRTGILAATVPAFWDGLTKLHRDATLSMADLLAPAITVAEQGFPVTEQFSRWVANNASVISGDEALRALYLPDGDAPARGTVHRNRPLADLLSRLCSPGGQRAWLAAAILDAVAAHGGLFDPADVERTAAETVATGSVTSGGARVHVTPAPTQGPVLALALAVADRLHGTVPPHAWPHVLVEILKLSFYERLLHLSDPQGGHDRFRYDGRTVTALAASVGPEATPVRYRGWYDAGDTTSFVTADGSGGVVSALASLSLGFGAGVSALDGAVIFNNRLGRSATLDASHANACAPGSRPVNTIHAWLVEAGTATFAGGTPGGDAQAQWNLQALSHTLLESGSWPGAVGGRRFTVLPGADLIEAGAAEEVHVDRGATLAAALRDYGHAITERRDVGGCMRVLGVTREGRVSGGDDGRQQGTTAVVSPETNGR